MGKFTAAQSLSNLYSSEWWISSRSKPVSYLKTRIAIIKCICNAELKYSKFEIGK